MGAFPVPLHQGQVLDISRPSLIRHRCGRPCPSRPDRYLRRSGRSCRPSDGPGSRTGPAAAVAVPAGPVAGGAELDSHVVLLVSQRALSVRRSSQLNGSTWTRQAESNASCAQNSGWLAGNGAPAAALRTPDRLKPGPATLRAVLVPAATAGTATSLRAVTMTCRADHDGGAVGGQCGKWFSPHFGQTLTPYPIPNMTGTESCGTHRSTNSAGSRLSRCPHRCRR